MKLYGFPPSPNTWQVRALAAHLGVPLEFELVDLSKGGSRTPEFLALNPTGRTPALIDGAFKLWESNAIMQYIATQKANSLWPNDARTRADIMRWQSFTIAHWLSDAWIPVLSERFVKKVLNLGPVDEARVAKGAAAFAKEAAVLDAHLSKQKYLVDDSLTIADFVIAAPLFYAKQAELPLGQYPQLRAWFERVSTLPCWQQTAPQLAAAA
ncbi:MAG TPA: glutathione S-transferase family protein [Xanthobacteraceae bacterium]|jgi:glutathione S-transferase